MINKIFEVRRNNTDVSLKSYINECGIVLNKIHNITVLNEKHLISLNFQNFENRISILFLNGTTEFYKEGVCIFRIHSVKTGISVKEEEDYCRFVADYDTVTQREIFLQLQTLTLFI